MRYLSTMAKSQIAATSSFARWRANVGLTQAVAAEQLDVSLSQVKNWEQGINRASGDLAVPPYCVRVVMQMIADGAMPKAWPL